MFALLFLFQSRNSNDRLQILVRANILRLSIFSPSQFFIYRDAIFFVHFNNLSHRIFGCIVIYCLSNANRMCAIIKMSTWKLCSLWPIYIERNKMNQSKAPTCFARSFLFRAMQLVGNLSCNKWFTIEPINTRLVRVIYSIDVIYRNRFFLFLYISLYALTVTQPEKHPKHNDTPTAIYISHSVLIIHHFTIVKLFVRHWLRSPTLQMQSRNPTIVCKSTTIVSVQSANLRPPSEQAAHLFQGN